MVFLCCTIFCSFFFARWPAYCHFSDFSLLTTSVLENCVTHSFRFRSYLVIPYIQRSMACLMGYLHFSVILFFSVRVSNSYVSIDRMHRSKVSSWDTSLVIWMRSVIENPLLKPACSSCCAVSTVFYTV